MHIIGLHGSAGSGKDYTANMLRDHFGYYKLPLALHGKAWLHASEGFGWNDLFESKQAECRTRMQQHMNDEVKPTHGKYVWCKVWDMLCMYMESQNRTDKFVIPDVRFIEEIRYFKAHRHKVIHIHAPTRERTYALQNLTIEQRNHASENPLGLRLDLECDGVINNDAPGGGSVMKQLYHILSTWGWV